MPNPPFRHEGADRLRARAGALKIGSTRRPAATCGAASQLRPRGTRPGELFEWGFDYLKHDCVVSPRGGANRTRAVGGEEIRAKCRDAERRRLMKPKASMRAALDKQRRDIVLQPEPYGMGLVRAWFAEVAATAGAPRDITDTWGKMAGIGFAGRPRGVAGRATGTTRHAGRWPVGWGQPAPDPLTQRAITPHLAVSLLASPFADRLRPDPLDPFTLNLLTTTRCSKSARIRSARRPPASARTAPPRCVQADGRRLVGGRAFNAGSSPPAHGRLASSPARPGQGPRPVRQQELGSVRREFRRDLPLHGCALGGFAAAS